MNRENRNVRIRNRCGGYSLFFIKPARGINLNDSAKELMNINTIKEVMITSGRYGFVVKCPSEIKSETEVKSYIRKHYGKSSKLECHYQFVK